jgi:DNA-binding transcriptional ArsR family regulator
VKLPDDTASEWTAVVTCNRIMSETHSADDRDTDPIRETHPSGWLVLTKNASAAKIIDALLDLPPHREFNQSELADQAGVSRQSVSRHLDLLLGIEVIEEVADTRPQRYRFDPTSDVSQAIIQLDGAMNAAGPEA